MREWSVISSVKHKSLYWNNLSLILYTKKSWLQNWQLHDDYWWLYINIIVCWKKEKNIFLIVPMFFLIICVMWEVSLYRKYQWHKISPSFLKLLSFFFSFILYHQNFRLFFLMIFIVDYFDDKDRFILHRCINVPTSVKF